jgi:short subunit dehydrogenase-like uncharacterized protein
MHDDILIYGANGYTAGLIIERAVASGATPVLAGRTEATLRPLAERAGLALRVFPVDDAYAVASNLHDIGVVINCAGPFVRTATCPGRRLRAHGRALPRHHGRDRCIRGSGPDGPRSRRCGVMLMPGVGFDVVPSDCLAAHLKRRLPDATRLTLAFRALGSPSHGTATTMIENLHRGSRIRADGRIIAAPAGFAQRNIDFGRGPVPAMCIAWGDVATAYHSTGIPDIAVYMAAPQPLRWISQAASALPGVTGSAMVRKGASAHRRCPAPAGPDAAARRRGRSLLWGEVRNGADKTRGRAYRNAGGLCAHGDHGMGHRLPGGEQRGRPAGLSHAIDGAGCGLHPRDCRRHAYRAVAGVANNCATVIATRRAHDIAAMGRSYDLPVASSPVARASCDAPCAGGDCALPPRPGHRIRASSARGRS